MAGTKKASLNERNRRICLYRRNGFTYSEIADLDAKLIILGEEEAALNALMARRGKSVSAAVP